MKLLVITGLLVSAVYPLSYVKYVWQKKNYLGALGMLFLTFVSLAFPAYLVFRR
ncbi:MAG: hypothetical protein GX847_02670 [Clostridiales bacterium]|nr:hypothetical protein [Clostridiales bacterium]